MRSEVRTDEKEDGAARRRQRGVHTGVRRRRRLPLLRLLAYYAVVVGVAALVAWFVPVVRDAFVSPIVLPTGGSGGELFGAPNVVPTATHPARRSLIAAIVMAGTVLVTAPVAWVYIYTRRLRYDPALVQSMIVLPIVVAGIVIVVKNSLALAFSLAGIVAAVRFRNTLKDPREAVYIFLALGLGLAAGVQALDIALVVSIAFNVLVLLLWRYDLGAVSSRSRRSHDILSVGDPAALVARSWETREATRRRASEAASDMDPDGVLLVHASDTGAARRAVEVALSGVAKRWRFLPATGNGDGVQTMEVVLELKKKSNAVDLLGDIEDRWADQVLAAEFIPYEVQDD